MFDGRLIMLRINSVVADQKQEQAFVSLNNAGSFMDCSNCVMPYRETVNVDNEYTDEISEGMHATTAVQVYQIQTLHTPAASRNLVETVKQQLLVERHIDPHFETVLPQTVLRRYKIYLQKVSTLQFIPALSAMYGFGTAPFQLYDSIRFHRLQAFDLGAERDLPEMAFNLLRTLSYNKEINTKSALVRLANDRFRELSVLSGVYLSPFRSSSNEIHACMTGTLRSKIASFLWIVLLGLQPDTAPTTTSCYELLWL